jgi:hypothetical protein
VQTIIGRAHCFEKSTLDFEVQAYIASALARLIFGGASMLGLRK